MLIVLFGLAGSGKSFVGQVLANVFHYYFWDADEVLPVKMQECIRDKKPFTQDMRDELTQIIINKTNELRNNHQNIVISQALYKEKNRREIQTHFPDALFIQIKSNSKIITQRLKTRHNWVDEDYAKKLEVNFELPILAHHVIINNKDEAELINQLKQLLNQ